MLRHIGNKRGETGRFPSVLHMGLSFIIMFIGYVLFLIRPAVCSDIQLFTYYGAADSNAKVRKKGVRSGLLC